MSVFDDRGKRIAVSALTRSRFARAAAAATLLAATTCAAAAPKAPPSAPSGVAVPQAPALVKLPDLAITYVDVSGISLGQPYSQSYAADGTAWTVITHAAGLPGSNGQCDNAKFTLGVSVKNVGQADFVKAGNGLESSVQAAIGPSIPDHVIWGRAFPALGPLKVGERSRSTVEVSVPPGDYLLNVSINAPGLSQSRSDNDSVKWALRVICDAHAPLASPATSAQIQRLAPGAMSPGQVQSAPAAGGGFGAKVPKVLPVAPQSALSLSDRTAARLRAAGFDPADSALGQKLHARLAQASPRFLNEHPSAVRVATPTLKGSSKLASGQRQVLKDLASHTDAAMNGGSGANGTMNGGSGANRTMNGGSGANRTMRSPLSTIQKVGPEFLLFADDHVLIATVYPIDPPTMDAKHDNFNGGRYYAGFRTSYIPALDAHGTVALHGTLCGNWGPEDTYLAEFGVHDGQSKEEFGYSITEVTIPRIAVGARTQDVSVKVDLGPLGIGTFTVTVLPLLGATAKVTLTVGPSPPYLSDNAFGLTPASGAFGSAGVTRLDPAINPSVSNVGDDILGLGVQLGPGWSVTSAQIVAAHSVLDAPNVTTPDIPGFRGASISKNPPPGRLEAGVHWHYEFAESLSYTIEWTLTGPVGQRPLMTMPLSGPCDS